MAENSLEKKYCLDRRWKRLFTVFPFRGLFDTALRDNVESLFFMPPSNGQFVEILRWWGFCAQYIFSAVLMLLCDLTPHIFTKWEKVDFGATFLCADVWIGRRRTSKTYYEEPRWPGIFKSKNMSVIIWSATSQAVSTGRGDGRFSGSNTRRNENWEGRIQTSESQLNVPTRDERPVYEYLFDTKVI